MEFDPLLLFSPASPSPESPPSFASDYSKHTVSTPPHADIKDVDGLGDDLDLDDLTYLHIHDLPLLAMKPPAGVLETFLLLLAPDAVCNFAPAQALSAETEVVFAEKKVDHLVDSTLEWLRWNSRFPTRFLLASVSLLAETLRHSFPQDYNSWLTRIIASDLAWTEPDADRLKALASLRLAENCGRTAQPELLRNIVIPQLEPKIVLKEPSLTADNLGLKTWGSSFVLGSRLARHPEYLQGLVLELGAGTGLVGMVACLLGFRTMLTDLAEILPNLTDNVELNHITNASVDVLDWSDPASFLHKHGPVKYTTVILSDPLYSSKHPVWIVDMLNTFLSSAESARVLLQVPLRRSFEKERDHLWRLLLQNGYVVEEEAYEDGYDDFGEIQFCFKKLVRAVEAEEKAN